MKLLFTSLLAGSLAVPLVGCGPDAVVADGPPTQSALEAVVVGPTTLEEAVEPVVVGPTTLEEAVEADVQTFETLLRNGDPELVVRRLLPNEETAGATIFPRGPSLRFWVQRHDYGHDGWQVSVSGDALRIRESYAGLSGTHLVEESPAQVERAVRETYADLDYNIRAAKAGRYVIKPGDSLEAIAGELNTTVEALMALNGLTSDELRAGQTLTIASWP